MYMTATERALGRQKTAGQVLGVGVGAGSVGRLTNSLQIR